MAPGGRSQFKVRKSTVFVMPEEWEAPTQMGPQFWSDLCLLLGDQGVAGTDSDQGKEIRLQTPSWV